MESNSEVMQHFANVLKAENAISQIKTELDKVTFEANQKIANLETEVAKAWDAIKAHMQDTGEYEIILPGSATDYKIGYSTPRESVKVDVDAVPDEWVKLERKPKLKEIGEHLKAIRAEGGDLPNWGRFELGEKKLQWRAVKK